MSTPTTDTPFWEQPEQVERFAARDPDLRLQELVRRYDDPASTRVLDLGCAGGRNSAFLAEHGFDLVAVDGSRAMVAKTRARVAAIWGGDERAEEEARRRVRHGRMDELSWLEDGSCDLIVALGIYHAARSEEEWSRTLGESVRVLAPGGLLLVAVFTPETDLTGEGVQRVPGEDHVYEGLPGGRRAYMVRAEVLDREMAHHGLEPAEETETVHRELETGCRVTVNGLYQKSRRESA
jgi:SAM-dependent methyltransferase